MKPRSIVFDLYGAHLRYRGGEASLRTLVSLMEHFGVAPATTRAVMARLRKEGWFLARPGLDGREVVYCQTDQTWQLFNEGRDRIFADPQPPWDGWWDMVIYYVPEASRATRDELRKQLSWLGFGPLAAATWVSPHDRLERVREAFGPGAFAVPR